jgi:hypothetical protein
MYQYLPGYSKSLDEAVNILILDSKKQEVVFSNGSGLKLTRDDAYGKAKQQKGGKVINTHVYKDVKYLIFAP